MAQELKIVEEKQVVCYGFVQYSQEIVELAKQGYVLDIRNRTCPQFQLGLFTCSMLLLEDEDGKEEIVVPPVAADNVVTPAKKAAGRPSKADKDKAELQAKLGDATNSIR